MKKTIGIADRMMDGVQVLIGKGLLRLAALLLLTIFSQSPMGAQSLAQTGKEDGKAKTLPEIIDINSRAVGLVATLDASGDYQEKFSCFFIGPSGVFVTAYHPLAEADGLEVILPDGRKSREVSVVSIDPRKDIAILKVAAEGLPAVVLGDSDRNRVGDSVALLSRPLGTFPSAVTGIISAIRDSKRGLRLHQLSAPVTRSGLGGPALNERGEIVGMVSFYRLFDESLGFIVPINYIRGLLGEQSAKSFADFVKTRQRVPLFDPALAEAKRLAIIDKARVSSFQMRDSRVKWEQVGEVIGRFRAELLKEFNAYGSTASEIFLADPFEVAEHRRLVASLTFTFQEIFAVGEGNDAALFPLAPSFFNSASSSVLEVGSPLYGKKGENKGKVSKIIISYNRFSLLPAGAAYMTPDQLSTFLLLSATLSRLVSAEEMPDLSISIFYPDVTDNNKEKEAESIWSNDAFTVRWGEIKARKLWDVQEKFAAFQEQKRQDRKRTSK